MSLLFAYLLEPKLSFFCKGDCPNNQITLYISKNEMLFYSPVSRVYHNLASGFEGGHSQSNRYQLLSLNKKQDNHQQLIMYLPRSSRSIIGMIHTAGADITFQTLAIPNTCPSLSEMFRRAWLSELYGWRLEGLKSGWDWMMGLTAGIGAGIVGLFDSCRLEGFEAGWSLLVGTDWDPVCGSGNGCH